MKNLLLVVASIIAIVAVVLFFEKTDTTQKVLEHVGSTDVIGTTLTSTPKASSTLPKPIVESGINYKAAVTSSPKESIIKQKLCTESAASDCELRTDVDLTQLIFTAPEEMDNNVLKQIMFSTNFVEIQNQLDNKRKSPETIVRQNEYSRQFQNFQVELPDILDNSVACSNEICAATFSLTNANSFEELSAKVDKSTESPNGHFYVTDGLDASGNFQARYIFSLATNLKAYQ